MTPSLLLLDLDDTLYPQSQYLAAAVRSTAQRAGELGLDQDAFAEAFTSSLAAGSDRGGCIDAALAALSAPLSLVPDLVHAFTGTSPLPGELTLYPGARDVLHELSAHLPLVLVTDGTPAIQRAKIASLGISHFFSHVLITDELAGRSSRKPCPESVSLLLSSLSLSPKHCVMVGDRPEKDVELAHRLSMPSIRVRTGEYASTPSSPPPTREIPDLSHLPAALASL